MRNLYIFLACFLILYGTPLYSQTNEYLVNPSFEDIPRSAHPPEGWSDCGFPDESAVDVHGPDSNFFGVKEFAAEGETFVGMVTRDNETYEGVSTKLLQPLLADSTYEITIMVNQAEEYRSLSRATTKPVSFSSPTLLEIWGGVLKCQTNTFVWRFKIEDYGYWDKVTVLITPEKNITYLSFYARHPENYDYTNGHILIDDLQIARVNPITFEKR